MIKEEYHYYPFPYILLVHCTGIYLLHMPRVNTILLLYLGMKQIYIAQIVDCILFLIWFQHLIEIVFFIRQVPLCGRCAALLSRMLFNDSSFSTVRYICFIHFHFMTDHIWETPYLR